VDGPSEPARTAPESAGAAVLEARQRWRLVLRREPDAAPLNQRDLTAALDDGLAASGLPLVPSGRSRSRIAFGAPLPVGMPSEHELADLLLAERVPAHEVRDRLSAALPAGFRLVDLYDVWLGEPSLVSQVVAADYRVIVEPPVSADELQRAAASLLDADHLPRERAKGAGVVRYDLRPLLADIAIVPGGRPSDPSTAVRIRTRFHPELGTGRPEEVVGALGEQLGRPLRPATIVRERVLLAGDA
jgi:radical SAM-linked protein